MKVLDLFSGIGCFSLGLQNAGFQTIAFCEIDSFCRKVLQKHWPDVPCYPDIRELKITENIDVLCGGFPCQNISNAAAAHGGQLGLAGEQSGLWYEYARLIESIKPKWVLIENVEALARNGLDGVLRSLAKIGYDAQWDVIPGWAVGAPQARKRLWVVAYPSSKRVPGLFKSIRAGASRQGWPGGTAHLQDVSVSPFEQFNSVPQPLLRGMDDRPKDWAHRLHALGNAVIPQIPELIGREITKYD